MVVSDGERTKLVYIVRHTDNDDNGQDHIEVEVARLHLPHIKKSVIHSFDKNASAEIKYTRCSIQHITVANPFTTASM